MSYLSSAFTVYLDDLASGKPAPGGGSAAALAGALGAALGSMVANFTVGKEKFASVEAEAQAGLTECERLRAALSALVQADVEAYGRYAQASKLPKSTEEEKAHRQAVIQEALEAAADVPMQVCRKCLEVLEVCNKLLTIGNPNLVRDVGCAAELANAGLRCALLNVEVNHAFIKNDAYIEAQSEELSGLLDAADTLRENIWAETRKQIND
jgi:methenyltetrahydrofolate cyclohydrolase